MTSIENLDKIIGKILLIWSIASIIVGIALYFFSLVALFQGIGLQFVIWGFINLALAQKIAKRTDHNLEKIRREISISFGMDLIYPIIGLPLVFLGPDAYFVGNGYGILLQGAFLLVLDLAYLRRFNQLT